MTLTSVAPDRLGCSVCCGPLADPIFRSRSDVSLTSLCTLQSQPTIVYSCPTCGHLQTPALGDLDEYYASTYRILIDSEEEDQLYDTVDGRQVFRAEHQATTFLSLVRPAQAARVLDFGAAKGATMRQVVSSRPDLQVHFFDVSDMYVDYWRRIVADDAFATHTLPEDWLGSFDVVTSFFMLEHVEHPVDVLTTVRSLLRPGGIAYLIVPNPIVNIADFVVVDHTNHFVDSSLERAFVRAGFDEIALDETAHQGAWTVTARRPTGASDAAPTTDVTPNRATAAALADYWTSVVDRIAEAERSVASSPAAIYGAGFYGSYIRAALEHPEQIAMWIDQNPYLHGREHFGLPVVAPADLPQDVRDIYVGLNPRAARSIIEGVEVWQDRAIRFHYL